MGGRCPGRVVRLLLAFLWAVAVVVVGILAAVDAIVSMLA